MATATLTIEDAYRDWLGIPANKIPPDYYALLGLSELEKSSEKIQAATQARFKIVRPRCLRYPDLGSKLLNEIAAANVCLTHPRTKAEYDATLRARGQQAALELGQRFCRNNPRLREVLQLAEATLAEEAVPPPLVMNRPRPIKTDRRRTLVGITIGVGAFALAALLMFAAFSVGKQMGKSKAAPAPSLTPAPISRQTPVSTPTITPTSPPAPTVAPTSPAQSEAIARRSPRPPEADLARARAKIKQEIDIRRSELLDPVLLAHEMVEAWEQRKQLGDYGENFVRIDEARMLFIASRAAERAFEVASLMEHQYEVPIGETLKSTVRDLCALSPPLTSFEWAFAAKWAQREVRSQFRNQDYSHAIAALNLALEIYGLARLAEGSPEEHAQALREQTALGTTLMEWEKVKANFEALKASPDDEAANLAVGKYLCFTCGDWEQGARHLLASGEPRFMAPAKLDVVASLPANTANEAWKVDAAEAWMKLAEDMAASGEHADALALRRRARSLLLEAKSLSTGLQHARVVARLAQLDEAGVSD